MIFLIIFGLFFDFPATFSSKIRARRATTLDPFFYDDEPLSFMKKSTTRDPIFEDVDQNSVEGTKWTTFPPKATQVSWFPAPGPTFPQIFASTTTGAPKTTAWSIFGSETSNKHVFGQETTAKPIWKSFFGSALENETPEMTEKPLYGVETTKPLWNAFFGTGTTVGTFSTTLAPLFGGFDLETTTERPKTTTTVPWNSFFSKETTQRTTTTHRATPSQLLPSPTLSSSCLSPWFSHQNSCYFIESGAKRTMRDAEQRCSESGAHLFVPSTVKEFNQIMAKAPKDIFVWIGLYKSDEFSQARWQIPNLMSYKSLPWLLQRGYTDRGNGWKENAQCAAMFNPAVGKYVFWFDCQEQYNYVCQKKISGVGDTVDRFFG